MAQPEDRGEALRLRAGTARALATAYGPGPAPAITTLGLFVGPYRNLTTLSAAVLSMHPDCLVLNHGLTRLLGRRGISPWARPDSKEYRRFLRFAVAASTAGRSGDHGGDIAHSHAFDRDGMAEAAAALPTAEHPSTLVWKDSMRIVHHLRLQGRPPKKVVRRNPGVHFLVPVRNPLDCAVSNVRTGHARYLPVADAKDVGAVLDAILQELAGFARTAATIPGHVHLFYEDDEGGELFADLGRALGLDPRDDWLDLAAEAWRPENRYEHDAALRARFDRHVATLADELPELAGRLDALVRAD
jgi:hypothetical protein